MKSKKLKLEDLKVQSFVTEYDKKSGQTIDVKGGFEPTNTQYCSGGTQCFSEAGMPCTVETVDLCYSGKGQYCG